MTPQRNVPVMVLNWNGWDDTFACLDSLREASDVESVWLIDNGSDTDRTEEARRRFPGLTVHRWEQNYGWTGGYNRALQIAMRDGHEYAYLLNNDALVAPDFLTRALETMQQNDRLAAVGSRVTDLQGQLTFDGAFTDFDFENWNAPRLRDAHYAFGAAMLLRLDALRREGLFDERFFCYFEEFEWCLRVKSRGWDIAIDRHSVIAHALARSDLSDNRRYYLTRNRFLLILLAGRYYLIDELGRVVTTAGKPWARYRQVSDWFWSNVRRANFLRKAGDDRACSTILSAIEDALLRRYGMRIERAPSPFVRVMAHLQPLPLGLGSRLKAGVRRVWLGQ